MALAGFGSLWIVLGGFGSLWMVLGGCGWFWVVPRFSKYGNGFVNNSLIISTMKVQLIGNGT